MDINYSPVRFIVDPQAEISPDVRKEDKLVGWGEALYANSMRLVCAGVLQSLGSLEKAASVLWCVGTGFHPATSRTATKPRTTSQRTRSRYSSGSRRRPSASSRPPSL